MTMCVCVQLASRYTPICLAANRCISIASARPKEHTSLSINYSLYINYTFVKALPKHYISPLNTCYDFKISYSLSLRPSASPVAM